MVERFDIVLFGASGLTGKYTIPFIHKFTKECDKKLTWAVAGRSESKIKDALQEMQTRSGEEFGNVAIILADVTDEQSLNAMAQKARCIVNCCGPYRFYGEPVVKACIENGTHHLDVSGEPQYMEKMQLKYHELAKEKNVYVVSACGFDSVPCDLGIIFLRDKFDGTLNSVETYISHKLLGEDKPGPHANYGTWESAVYGIAFANELRALRTQLFPKRMPSFKPRLGKKSAIHKDEKGHWAVPFLMSDRSIAYRTQHYFYEEEQQRPVQVNTYMRVASLLHIFFMGIFGALFLVLAKFKFGQQLLLKFPGIFSGGFFGHEEPSEEKLDNVAYSWTICGKGWSKKYENALQDIEEPLDKEVIARVSGKNAYTITCVAVALCAILTLTESNNMPKNGGVYTPGAAFARTKFIEKLNDNGLKFEVSETKCLQS